MVDQLFLSLPFPSSFPVVDVCVRVCVHTCVDLFVCVYVRVCRGHINLSLTSWLGESVCGWV